MKALGLTSAEVNEKIKNGLTNAGQNVKTKSVGRIVLGNVFTFFNMLFVAFALLMLFLIPKNGVFEMNDLSNFGFMGVVVVNCVVGLWQELNAKRTVDKLSLLTAPKVTVVRDGLQKEIGLEDVVLGDVIMLAQGRQIPADAEVIQGELEVSESQITGEPDAIPKAEGDELRSGSFVVSGTAYAKVTKVGKDTYTAKISMGAKYVKPINSEIYRSLTKFIKLMSVVILPLGVLLFCVKAFAWKNEPLTTATTVLGSLIGMIPSGLMMLTSAVFCVSVVRMSRYKTLSQDLYSAETLARVDVLCLDKTGTITEGKMEVKEVIPLGSIGEKELIARIKALVEGTGDTNQTADAIKNLQGDTDTQTPLRRVAFSSGRKWSACVYEGYARVLGAPERVLGDNLCQEATALIAEKAGEGMRVLAYAECDGINEDNSFVSAPELLGLVVISDVIRKEAKDTLTYFAEQGVEVKIISGDSPVTVGNVAKRAGVRGAERYVDASELADEELAEALEKYVVFGRVMPDMKLKIVKELKAKGHTVAMTGDGVNDVLALKEADCSIAMASGSDAAKNVSTLVLLDNNFASLPKVVAEGRRTINNLERSASLYLLKTGYNLLIAIFFLMLNSPLPFEPKHLTLIGLVTIGIPSFVLALEPCDELVTGRFFPKVLANSLPGSVAVAVTVTAVTLFAKLLPTVTPEELSTVCLVVTTAIGLTYIGKISYPFNLLRGVLLVAMAGLFVSAFFLDFGFFSLPEFFGLSAEFTKEMGVLLAPSAVCGVGLFAGAVYLMKVINRKGVIERLLRKINL